MTDFQTINNDVRSSLRDDQIGTYDDFLFFDFSDRLPIRVRDFVVPVTDESFKGSDVSVVLDLLKESGEEDSERFRLLDSWGTEDCSLSLIQVVTLVNEYKEWVGWNYSPC